MEINLNSIISPRQFYFQLFSNLLNKCPKDTYNMVTHITMYESQDNYMIEIAAPYLSNPKTRKATINGYTDYAEAVNNSEFLTNGGKNPNYHWIEKTIERTIKVLNGGANL